MNLMGIILVIALILRLISLGIAKSNERKLKRSGAIEYGRRNTRLLILTHLALYASCGVEGYQQLQMPDILTWTGLALYVVTIGVLYYTRYKLRCIWTIKLFIAPRCYQIAGHSLLVRRVRHPRYYVALLLELCGLALIFHAWYTLFFGIAVYVVPLSVRIRQEELAARREFTHDCRK